MKLRILSLVLIFLSSNLSPASATTVTQKIVYNNKTVVTYTVVDSVTLDPNGCEEVYIKYTIDKSFFFPNAYVMFGLYAKDKNEALFMCNQVMAKALKVKMLGWVKKK